MNQELAFMRAHFSDSTLLASECLLQAFNLIKTGKTLDDVINARDLLTEYISIYRKDPLPTDIYEDADEIMMLEAQEKAKKQKKVKKQRFFTDRMLEEMQFLLIKDIDNGTSEWTIDKLAKHFGVSNAVIAKKEKQLKGEGSL